MSYYKANGRSFSGVNVMVWGDNNYVSGFGSIVIGNNNSVSGMNATVYGNNNSISGMGSTAYGYNNSFSGMNSRSYGPTQDIPKYEDYCGEEQKVKQYSKKSRPTKDITMITTVQGGTTVTTTTRGSTFTTLGGTMNFAASGGGDIYGGDVVFSDGVIQCYGVNIRKNKLYDGNTYICDIPRGTSKTIVDGKAYVNGKLIYPTSTLLVPLASKSDIKKEFSMLELEGNAEKAPEETMDNALCVICYNNLKNVLLCPCSHIVYCVECARTDKISNKCPICRDEFTSAKVVYM